MRKISALLLAGAMLAPAILVAQGPPAGPPAGRGMRLHAPGNGMGPIGPGPREGVFGPRRLLNFRQRLELTDEQVTQLEALAKATRDAHDKAAADAKPHEEKLAELWKAEQPDAGAIQSEMRALMQARQSAGLVAAANTAEAKGLLTDEQRGRVEGWVEGRRMGGRGFNRRSTRGQGPGYGYRQAPRGRRY